MSEVQPTAARRGPRPAWIGRRVRWIAGPDTGLEGTILDTPSGSSFWVATDDGRRLTPARTSVQLLDEEPVEGATPEALMAARRVLSLFCTMPRVHRAVVYRTPRGSLAVDPWVERDFGPQLMGVYTRGVTFAQLVEDLA